jgi:hypothetical protein
MPREKVTQVPYALLTIAAGKGSVLYAAGAVAVMRKVIALLGGR